MSHVEKEGGELTLWLSRPPLTSMDGIQQWPDDIDTTSTFLDESKSDATRNRTERV
jgi:hypothetical protein